jgi:hypothetical protein
MFSRNQRRNCDDVVGARFSYGFKTEEVKRENSKSLGFISEVRLCEGPRGDVAGYREFVREIVSNPYEYSLALGV